MDQEKALRNLTIVAKAILNLVERGASQEDVAPLFDVITDIADEVFARHLDGRPGKKPMNFSRRAALSGFAAAATVLKEGRTVDDVIAELAIPNRVDRKEVGNFRDRINRGVIDKDMYTEYLATFEKCPRLKSWPHSAIWQTAFVPNPR